MPQDPPKEKENKPLKSWKEQEVKIDWNKYIEQFFGENSLIILE